MPTMQRPRSISSATSSASTTANVCTQFWATCRPPSMSGTWQQINLSSCPNLLDHHSRPETQKRKLALHALPAGIISSPEASEECLDGIESRYVDKGQFFQILSN